MDGCIVRSIFGPVLVGLAAGAARLHPMPYVALLAGLAIAGAAAAVIGVDRSGVRIQALVAIAGCALGALVHGAVLSWFALRNGTELADRVDSGDGQAMRPDVDWRAAELLMLALAIAAGVAGRSAAG